MVAFQTEDRFFFLRSLPAWCSCPKNFRLPPKNSVLATCLNVMATFFENDVIFAMKSLAVQILYITLLFETES